MAYQSPLITIPRKTTSDVDWAGPLRTIIAQTYQENPNAYSEEIAAITRCRQDAVSGASSDNTARDLLYKYFGQLEHLETRFEHLKLPFIWVDAFTGKSITQSSLAYEKASILHSLASVESQVASSSSRADAEGIKRATQSTKRASGLLLFVNLNFLHPPSTDLTKDVVNTLVAIMDAQQSEILVEALLDKKLGPNTIANIANRSANEYKLAVEQMNKFEGQGIMDRNWLNLLQIKTKHFESFAAYHQAKGDEKKGKYGQALVRYKLADKAAQEAQRLAKVFTYTFQAASTPTIPHDGATNLLEITKAHATLCSEAKVQAQKDNDLIYHEILPSEASLPPYGSAPREPPIGIKEIFTPPHMSQLIGPDIFSRLVPMSVHQAASVYSEEKAKVVREVVEKVDMSEGEIRAGLEHLGFPGLITEWMELADSEGESDIDISSELARLADDIQRAGPLENLVGNLELRRDKYEKEVRAMLAILEHESMDCERTRAKYTPHFTQVPSRQHNDYWRETLIANLDMVTNGMSEDSHIVQLSHRIRPDIVTLCSGRNVVQKLAQHIADPTVPHQQSSAGMSLLDLDDEYGPPPPKPGMTQEEKDMLARAISEAKEKITRLGKVRAERDEVLRDLKEKVQGDDITPMLIMNSRNQDLQDQVIRGEIEKFTPHRSRISAAIDAARSIIEELEGLATLVARGKGLKERQRAQRDRKNRVQEWEQTLMESGAKYIHIREEAARATQIYNDVQRALADIGPEVKKFISTREAERNRMIADIETRERLSSSPPPPPPLKQGPSVGLDSQMAMMNLGHAPQATASASNPYPFRERPHRPIEIRNPVPAQQPPPTPASFDPYARPAPQANPPPVPSAPSPYPPPPPGRPSQSPLYPSPPVTQPSAYQPPLSTGQSSASYPYLTSPLPPPTWHQPNAPIPPKTYTSPPPSVAYPPYGAPPQPQYSAYPPPPPAPPSNQHQYHGYQPPPPPPPQGYNGYQPPQSQPQSGYQPPQSGYPYR